MKKKSPILSLLIICLCLCSCNRNIDNSNNDFGKTTYDVYKVIFDGNGGKLTEGKEIQYVVKGEEPIYPVYEKDMAEFIGFEKAINDEEKTVSYIATYQALTIKKVNPFDLLNDITFGWNYVTGNDEVNDDGRIYDLLLEKNINAVALPCSFYKHMNDEYVINDDYLLEIKTKADEALKRNMYVLICFYDSPSFRWSTLDYDNYDNFMKIIDVQVSQVGEYFKNSDEHVLFSFIGEPKDYSDYVFDKEAAMILNDANEKFVSIIRNQGGNNLYRNLIISAGGSNYIGMGYKYFKLIDDDYLIVRVHSYEPFGLIHEDTMDRVSWDANEAEYKMQLLTIMKTINENFIQKGIPVLIGEFGSRDKDNDEERAKWLEYYVSCAYSYGIKCFAWDSAKAHFTNDYTFALIDRTNYIWAFPELTDKLGELIKDGKYIPFYQETYNYTQSIDEEIIIPKQITNLLTDIKEDVEIKYDKSLVTEKDGKLYALNYGEIVFSYTLNDYDYYYKV
ncbi:MAG: glycoside hydrolase family 5 protein, partial [Bacilli bacterium]|nr:glycoside hydrolase family 5 protein [Bacilli bacterium]